MHKVSVIDYFSAAHNLRGYKGKCEELHGHNWKVEVSLESARLDKTGMVVDFKILKDKLKRVLKLLDHKYLNKLAYFKKTNPTSENIAKYIYDRLKCRVQSVSVWESHNSYATYHK